MNYILDILRQESPQSASRHQLIAYCPEDDTETVASALRRINAGRYADMTGAEVTPISWECSCLQKKCGACAMLINGRPGLACDAFLRQLAPGGIRARIRGGRPVRICLAPLQKFPLVRDLQVDRRILLENLKQLRLWRQSSETQLGFEQRQINAAHEASRCLQCGCCYEVCPNCGAGERFFGAAAFVPAQRLLSAEPPREQEELRRAYLRHVYRDCAKSLACQNICPAKIPVEELLSRANAAAVWGREIRK